MSRKRAIVIFISIAVITLIGGFFVYPAKNCITSKPGLVVTDVKNLTASMTGSTTKNIVAPSSSTDVKKWYVPGCNLPWRLGLDLVGGTQLMYSVDLSSISTGDQGSVMNGLRDVIERRVNLFGVSEPNVSIAKSGDSSRLVVELAGIKDVKSAIDEIGTTPFLLFAEVDDTDPENPTLIQTNLTGRYVQGAQLNFDNLTATPEVSISFNDEGAKLFEEITARNVGKQVAIVLDKTVISSPVVRERISGGKAQITGRFTVDEARKLVERFNAGALPAPIELMNQQTVGASLGSNSLNRVLYAGFIGTVVVMLFMMLYYRTPGIAACLALLIYIILTASVFKLFSVTMTLAGIAGFILSIGMAVDANVLIFERRKEEVKRGLARAAALGEGFKRAWPSIRDSNITTMITSLILYYSTTGFVRGFALTLGVGVLVSMFSAITVTRTILRVFSRQ